MEIPDIEALRQAKNKRLEELKTYLDSSLGDLRESTQAETRVFLQKKADILFAFTKACLELSLNNLEQQLTKAKDYKTSYVRKGWIENAYRNYEATQSFIDVFLEAFEQEFEQYLR